MAQYGMLLEASSLLCCGMDLNWALFKEKAENYAYSTQLKVERSAIIQIVILKLEEARIYVNRFDLVEAEKDLDWALDFWVGRREAMPTRNPNKCKSCEYLSKCKDAIK